MFRLPEKVKNPNNQDL